MSRENRRRRRLLRRPRKFGIRAPVLVDGQPTRMCKEYVSYLKASFRGRLYLGGREYTCSYCGAFFWYNERATYLSAFTQKSLSRSNETGLDSID